MASVTAVCNVSLGMIGEEKISIITEDSPGARACINFWDISRDAVLAGMQWSFATKRVELSQSSTEPDFGWDYQYPLPADFLEPIVVNEGTAPKWVIEGSNLLINESEVELVYIASIEDVGMWPALFIDAFSTRLAADICPSVKRDFNLQQKLMQLFDYKLQKAQSFDSSRRYDVTQYDQEAGNYPWLSVRD